MNTVICVPAADIYRFPSAASEHVDEALYGTRVTVTDRVAEFVRITDEYGYDGWTLEANTAAELASPSHMIRFPFADLLPDAKNFASPVMTLPMGAKVDIGFSDQFERYGFCVLPDKRVFYIHKAALLPLPREAEEDEARESIVENAAKYLGVQYRWGGRTAAGIDCSGLVFQACLLSGITVWRDADFDKTPRLRELRREDARPGDLYFFDGHVAIAIGDGDFIHASASAGCVTYGSFNAKSHFHSDWFDSHIRKTGSLF